MKKIIAAFDGLKCSASTREHSIEFARHTKGRLVLTFLEDPSYHSYHIYDLVSEEGDLYRQRNKLEKKDQKLRAAAITTVERACTNAGVDFLIHKDRNMALRDLVKESIYADLLVIDPYETFSHKQRKLPTDFIKDLLEDVQCPVVLVPPAYKPIQRLVMLFDGEPSSVYAIKMLGYSLSELKDLPTEIVTVKEPKTKMTATDRSLMKEFAGSHFPNATFKSLNGIPEEQIVDHIKSINVQTMVVLGAYKRGKVSRWFRHSMADLLMKELKLPIFIAHS
jgi:nucleotide-binding universal stress UspA family protein